MNPENSDQTLFMTRPEGLARILDDEATDLWTPDEMKAMWQHQLAAPVDVDLAEVTSVRATILRSSAGLGSFGGKTFGQLFADTAAPIELLELTKEFAKETLKVSEEKQLKEIASALYYASYAAGLLRYGKLIGSMKAEELKPGFKWAQKRSWLDDSTKALIADAEPLLAIDNK
jgi:hypothetical protein